MDDSVQLARKLLAQRIVRAARKVLHRIPLVLQAKPLAREPVEQRLPLRRVLPGPFHITFDTDLLREHALPNVDVDCPRPGQRAECSQTGGQTGRPARPADCLDPSYDLVCVPPVGAEKSPKST